MMDRSGSKEANHKLKHDAMNENFVNETPHTTNGYGPQEVSLDQNSNEQEKKSNSTNIHQAPGRIVSEEDSFNRWMLEM